jgi:hypothetical protein
MLGRTKQQPCIIGAVQHPKQSISKQAPEVDADADHPGDVGIGDFAWVLNNARVILDERGGFTVITDGDTHGEAQPNVRFQLPEGALFRISRDGDASERFLLSGPLVDYLQELADKVNGLTTQLNQLTSLLQAAIGNVVPPGIPSGILIPIADPVKADMQAATVHVSADTEAGEVEP